MAGLTNPRIAAISAALSTPRMSRYVATCGNDHARALDLYEWNAEVSAAFMVPMHICEIVLRNAHRWRNRRGLRFELVRSWDCVRTKPSEARSRL
jgi:hypothetical protein